MKQSPLILSAFLGLISAQQVGHQKENYHPPLSMKYCVHDLGCSEQKKSITLDANWRWLHKVGTYTNCYEGTSWDSSVCSDPDACAKNCALDGVPIQDWGNTYGVHANGDTLKLGYVTATPYGTNVGSRTYMLNNNDEYEMFQLLGKEFTFTVDVSDMPCGVNGALYFVEMDKTGNKGGNNQAGASYGTGYCDAQCPHDIKFMNGQANVINWNAGVGKWGTCCAEMDIWEANKISSAYTSHPCNGEGQQRCENPTDCGDNDNRYKGICDKDGCDLNPFRVGVKDFFGKGSGFTINTALPITVVTQFVTDPTTGDLAEIKRKFIQNGQIFEHPSSAIDKMDTQYDSITDDMCNKTKGVFGDENDHDAKGGLKKMGDALKKGMVLVMSIWDDANAHMLWLDSTYPTDKTTWGGPRGTCPTTSGVPEEVRAQSPGSYVKFSDIRAGDIDSTYQDLALPELEPKLIQ